MAQFYQGLIYKIQIMESILSHACQTIQGDPR